MSEPLEPEQPAGPSGSAPQPQPPQAGAQPPTEPEPTPSAAPPDQPTERMYQQPGGHYVWVPEGGRQRRFGPAFGRFARNRATHLVAAVVVGAVVGGGTVAIVDNVAEHQHPSVTREGQTGGPFGGGTGHRFPGFHFGGGPGSGN